MALAAAMLQQGATGAGTTSHVITLSSSGTAGRLLVVVIAYDNSGSSGADPWTSIADSRGGTWTLRNNALRDPGAASAGLALRVYERPQTATDYLRTSDTMTFTFGSTTAARIFSLIEVYSTTSGGRAVYSANATPSVGPGTTATQTTASLTSGSLVLGFCGVEYGAAITADSDTSNGSWSTMTNLNTGTTLTGMALCAQTKVVTATATQTYNTSWANTTDYILGWVSYIELITTTKHSGQYTLTSVYGDGSSTTVGSHNLGNTMVLRKITLDAVGSKYVLDGFVAYVYQDGGSARAILYADNAGSPGALLGLGPDTAIANTATGGFQQFNLTAPPLNASTSYWIGLIGSNGTTSDLYNMGTTGYNSYIMTEYNTSNPASPPSGGTAGTYRMDIYTVGYWDRFSYDIRNLASDTLTPTYDIHTKQSQTLTATYDILAQLTAVLKTLTATYDMRQLGTKTLTPTYNLLNKVAQTLAPSYSLRQLATKTLAPAYNLRQLVAKTLAPSYSLRQLATKTLAPAYNLLNGVSKSLTPEYSMRQLATKTLAPAYNIVNFASKTLTATYDLRNKAAQTLTPVYDIYSTLTSVLKTLVATYDMRQLGTKTLVATYNILTGPFTKTLTPTYDVRQLFGKTLSPSYSMRQLATKTVVPTYNIINLSGKTLSPTYNIVNYAGKTLAPSYNVRQLGTKTLAPTYNLRQLAAKALTPSYNMRSLVNKPLTATYSMRESVRKELSPNYFLRQLSGKTLTPLYSVFNSQSKTLSVTYNLREAVGANLIPSYYITENANLSVTFTFAIERPQGERGYRIIGVSIGGVEITRDIMDTGGVEPTEFVSPRIQNGGPKTCR